MKNQNKQHEKWRYIYRKIGIAKRFNFENIKQTRQSRVVEVKVATYGEI